MTPPPLFDDETDRHAILARRAAFVASALASLVQPRNAHADEELRCPDETVDPDAREAARAAESSLREGRTRVPTMPIPEQVVLAERIYGGAPTAANALVAMDLLVEAGDPERARRLGELFQVCRTPSADVAARLDGLSRRFARVVLVPSAPGPVPAANVRVGASTVTFVRALEGVLVDPSATVVEVTMDDGTTTRLAFQAVAGQVVRVVLPTPVPTPPMPCLTIAPDPARRANKLRLGVELYGGPAILPATEPQVHPAFGPRVAFDLKLVDDLRLQSTIAMQIGFVDRVAGPSAEEPTVALVTEASLLGYVAGGFALGGGLVAGYQGAPSDARYFLTSSPFVGPVLVPFAWRGGTFSITLRVPVAFADTVDHAEHAVRVAWIAPQLGLGLVFDVLDVDEPTTSASR